MVKGLDIFHEYFSEYTNQYVLIGGAACSISFEEQELDFGRTTKDLDMVLIVEAQTKEFVIDFGSLLQTAVTETRQEVMESRSSTDSISL